MGHSKYLDALSPEQREQLILTLHNQQNHICFICEDTIDLNLQRLDIDHVKPLALGGPDDPTNFALTNFDCNRQKQDSNLYVARCMKRYDKTKDKVYKETGLSPNLSHLLLRYGGSKFLLPIEISGNEVRYSLEEAEGKPIVYKTNLWNDDASGFQSFFAYLPMEYVFHDEKGINPRTLSERVKELIKEFYLKRPQLHTGLARINSGKNPDKAKVFIFDGQHKAAAQILLGIRKIALRIFVNPDLVVLTQTNERAGTDLRQIAFDLSARQQLGSTILAWKIETFQKDKGLRTDEYSFSEKDLIYHFRGEREVKTFISEYIRNAIGNDKNNKLRDYLTFGGKEKDKPLSYSAINKTLFSNLLSQDPLDARPFFSKPRQNEIFNVVQLMNIIAEEVMSEYSFDIGAGKIEDEVRKEREGKSTRHIPDSQLRIVRMTKEEIMFNWITYIRQIAYAHFAALGSPMSDEKKVFQEEFDDILWNQLRNFVRNLKTLPMWVDREKTHVFSAKYTNDYWSEVFKTGTTKDGLRLLPNGINTMSMIR
jgi:hypothetical protein